jgi:hypothetical protein
MKSTIIRHVTTATLLGAALVVVCFSAVTANARSAVRGKFTLPYEVRWGRAVLPAGDYLFTYTEDSSHPTVVVRDANTFRTVALERVDVQESGAKGESALLIGTRGEHRVVHSLRIAELGQVLVYDPALGRARVVEEVRQARAIPIVVAKN